MCVCARARVLHARVSCRLCAGISDAAGEEVLMLLPHRAATQNTAIKKNTAKTKISLK